MQPVYRIPGEMLREHVARLCLCSRVKEFYPELYPLLFLSGLHVAFGYYKASRDRDDVDLTPLHLLDDGLCDRARSCLPVLVKRVRSRDIQGVRKFVSASTKPMPTWVAVQIAFIGFFTHCPSRVEQWISRGCPESNRIRLACAMGIESFWNTRGGSELVHAIMNGPLELAPDEFSAISAFSLTSENALPKL